MPHCLISLGSNQGDRLATLEGAIASLRHDARLHAVRPSRWFTTHPVGGPEGQADYLNGAACFDTSLNPEQVLALLQEIETHFGRIRRERWGDRTLDLDLLLYGDRVLETPSLALPHPRMAWRRFVLEPAAEIAGAMRHPTTGMTLAELLDNAVHGNPYVAITGLPRQGKSALAFRVAAATKARCLLDPPTQTEHRNQRLPADGPDRSGRDWAAELEWTERRMAALACTPTEPQSQVVQTVSDFWIGQSAAYARVFLEGPSQSQFFAAWGRRSDQRARPKLLVLLDSPFDDASASGNLREASCAPATNADNAISPGVRHALHKALLGEVEASYRGPVLRWKSADRDEAFREVVAAIAAMEESSP
jgi:2-amino-4-hydroxy-6-hydroxymethyldihydropteridine diphosphokinase